VSNSIEVLIETAKKLVEQRINDNFESTRLWECIGCIDSYENKAYRIELHVYTGSPIKGYVIVSHGTGTVRAFGVHDKILKTFKFTIKGVQKIVEKKSNGKFVTKWLYQN
jgi:hypothetical protein